MATRQRNSSDTAEALLIGWRPSEKRKLSRFGCTSVVAVLLVLGSLSCAQVEANRQFQRGVRAYQRGAFDEAIASFERAYEVRTDPAILYNLALCHLQSLRALTERASVEESEAASERALAAVREALSARGLDDETESKLRYVEGSILALAGDSEQARTAFERSLAARPDFRPSLKAIVELSPEAQSAPVRLLLSLTEIDEPPLEQQLAP